MTKKTRPTLCLEKLKTLTAQDVRLPRGGSCCGTGGDGAGGGLK